MDSGEYLLSLAKNGQRTSKRDRRGFTEYEVALATLAEEIYENSNPDVSLLELEEGFDTIIKEVAEEGGSISVLNSRKHKYLSDVHNRFQKQYELTFPLNIRTGSTVSPPRRIKYRDIVISKVPRDRLKHLYGEIGWLDVEGKSKLDRLSGPSIEYRPDRSESLPGYSITLTGSSIGAVTRKFEDKIDSVLGLLNYLRFESRHYALGSSDSEGNGLPTPVTGPPFMIFESSTGELKEVQRTEHPAYKASIRPGVESKLKQMPDFTTDTPLDKAIIPGLRAYQDALTSPGKESAFLAIWRGLESVTFTDRNSNTNTAVKRTIPFQDMIPRTILEPWIENQLTEKRNDIAHDAERRPILTRDIRLLEFLLLRTMDKLLEFRAEGRGQEIQGIMENDLGSNETIQQKLQRHEDAAGKLRAALDWRD